MLMRDRRGMKQIKNQPSHHKCSRHEAAQSMVLTKKVNRAANRIVVRVSVVVCVVVASKNNKTNSANVIKSFRTTERRRRVHRWIQLLSFRVVIYNTSKPPWKWLK